VAEIESDRVPGCAAVELHGARRGGDACLGRDEGAVSRYPVARRNLMRLRNRVVHGYWSVDVGVLHTTASEQLGEFVQLLRGALAELSEG
jgi:hypothetical protein